MVWDICHDCSEYITCLVRLSFSSWQAKSNTQRKKETEESQKVHTNAGKTSSELWLLTILHWK